MNQTLVIPESRQLGQAGVFVGWITRAEERGRVFLSVCLLFVEGLQPITKGTAEPEQANEESAASTMASNWNKLGYSVTKKIATSLSCLLRDL